MCNPLAFNTCCLTVVASNAKKAVFRSIIAMCLLYIYKRMCFILYKIKKPK